MNQKTTLSAGIEEYLDTNHEQTVLLNHIGYNQVDLNGSSEKVLSFYILLGSDNQEKLLQAGSVFEFQNSRWKVVSINTAENGNIKHGQAESVTFEPVA
jgi:hypothetical protein